MQGLDWFVDEIVGFRNRAWVSGWVHHPTTSVTGLAVGLPGGERHGIAETGLASPRAAERHGAAAAACGFRVDLPLSSGRYADELALWVSLDDGSEVELVDLHGPATDLDPFHALERSFWQRLAPMPGAVLEVGARNRSGPVRRHLAGRDRSYVGFDIRSGENVDVVGDAHELSSHFRPASFAAVFAVATFEHLVMPWKAVLELNRVLQPGGLVWVSTHQTFPLHEIPWDFWRYSNDGWRGLFNPRTGFAILDVAMGEPAAVVTTRAHRLTRDMDRGQAYLGAGVIAQKIGETSLTWPVTTGEVIDSSYPA